MSNEEMTMTAVTRVDESRNDMSMVVAEAEARASLLKMVLPKLVSVCHSRNIIDMGGNPYIDNDGCQKIARIVGVSYGTPTIDHHFEDDPETGKRVFVVDVTGEASAFGQTIIEVGGATSDDKFFQNRRESFQETRQEVRKKALANWQGRCIRTLLGLKEMSWEELEAQKGFRKESASKVEYREGRRSGSDKEDAKGATSDVKSKIQTQIMEDVGGNQQAFEYVLSEITAFEGDKGWVRGKKEVSALTDKWAFRLWSEIKPDGKKREDYQDKVYLATQQFGKGESSAPAGDNVPF